MELRLDLVDAGRGMRLTTIGIVPGALVVECHRVMLEEHLEAFASCRYWFADHSRLRALEIDSDDTREVARIGRSLTRANPGLVVANLASGDLEYGILRMWQAHADDLGWTTRTSRDEQQLLTWLGQQLDCRIEPRSIPVGRPLFHSGGTVVPEG